MVDFGRLPSRLLSFARFTPRPQFQSSIWSFQYVAGSVRTSANLSCIQRLLFPSLTCAFTRPISFSDSFLPLGIVEVPVDSVCGREEDEPINAIFLPEKFPQLKARAPRSSIATLTTAPVSRRWPLRRALSPARLSARSISRAACPRPAITFALLARSFSRRSMRARGVPSARFLALF